MSETTTATTTTTNVKQTVMINRSLPWWHSQRSYLWSRAALFGQTLSRGWSSSAWGMWTCRSLQRPTAGSLPAAVWSAARATDPRRSHDCAASPRASCSCPARGLDLSRYSCHRERRQRAADTGSGCAPRQPSCPASTRSVTTWPTH